jgi:hypothetical protein
MEQEKACPRPYEVGVHAWRAKSDFFVPLLQGKSGQNGGEAE